MGLNHLEYKIVRAGSEKSFMQTDLVVLYVLEGEMSVRYYGDKIRMKKDDICCADKQSVDPVLG